MPALQRHQLGLHLTRLGPSAVGGRRQLHVAPLSVTEPWWRELLCSLEEAAAPTVDLKRPAALAGAGLVERKDSASCVLVKVLDHLVERHPGWWLHRSQRVRGDVLAACRLADKVELLKLRALELAPSMMALQPRPAYA